MVFGSGSVVSRLSELGLIDEYQFVVCPVLLGGGRQLVSGMSGRVSLELLEAQAVHVRQRDASLRAEAVTL